MNQDYLIRCNEINNVFSLHFSDFISKFSNSFSINYNQAENVVGIEIILNRDSNKRKLNFIYEYGVFNNCDIYQRYLFSIETLKNNTIRRNKFFIQDYAQFKNLEYNQYIPIEEWEDYIERLKDVFKQVKIILTDEDLQEILYTDKWIEIPINWTPYK